MANYTLTNGDDVFPEGDEPTDGDDYILALDGSDFIDSGEGANTVYGGGGFDFIFAHGPEDQAFFGGLEDDDLTSAGGDDVLDGGAGSDVLASYGGADSIYGGDDRDYIFVNYFSEPDPGYSHVEGGDGDDAIDVRDATAQVLMGAGDDDLTITMHNQAGFQPSVVDGGAGRDRLFLDYVVDYVEFPRQAARIDVTATASGIETSVDGVLQLRTTAVELLYLTLMADHVAASGTANNDSFYLQGSVEGAEVFGGDGDDIISVLGLPDGHSFTGTYLLDGGTGKNWLFLAGAGSSIFLDARPGAGLFGLEGYAMGSVDNFGVYQIETGGGDDTIHLGKGVGYIFEAKDDASGDDYFSMGKGIGTAYAMAGNDTLIGEGGEDALYGGAGADTIRGGTGADFMEGGAANDVFVFRTLDDSGTASGEIDRIALFSFFGERTGAPDRIDVSKIDAIAGTDANDAFTFIGSADFTAEGQIRAEQVKEQTYLWVNTTGPGGAEMKIWLTDYDADLLTAAHFIL